MAIIVKFDAKDVLGKDYELMDTFDNVKIVAKGMEHLLDALNKEEEKKGDNITFLDYDEVINEETKKNVATVLGLTGEAAKKIDGMSRSDVSEFYSELVEKFCQMEVPSVARMREIMEQAQSATTGQVPEADAKDKDENDPK